MSRSSTPTSRSRSLTERPNSSDSSALERLSWRRARHVNHLRKSEPIRKAISLVYKYKVSSVAELYDNCKAHEWAELVYTANGDCVHAVKIALELYTKDCLELQRANRWEWFIKDAPHHCYHPEQCRELSNLFRKNNIVISDFVRDLYKVLMCIDEKKNTLRLIGTSNSGKSLLAAAICDSFVCAYVNNHNSENEFYLSSFLNKAVCLCEELFTTTATAEDFKSILAGAPISISKKYNEKQKLCRTPIIVTSNHSKFGRGHITAVDELALQNRCYTYVFTAEVRPACHIDPITVAHFLRKHLPPSLM